MLNLYIAPRQAHFIPTEENLKRAIDFLVEQQILGAETEEGYAPGREISFLFAPEHTSLLPAEMTLENFSVRAFGPPRFLPERQLARGFSATCKMCGDDLDEGGLDASLEKLAFCPVERFTHECPSCRNVLELKNIDFGQRTTVACFWFYLEGCPTVHLRQNLIEHLGRLLGVGLQVIPEKMDEQNWPGEEALTELARRRR